MRYFPAFFDLQDRPVFVTGGGEIAVRKLRLLAKASPKLYVFSVPKGSIVEREFGSHAALLERPLAAQDFALDPALVVAAEDEEGADGRTAALARENGSPVNVVDQPALCDVVIPSIVDRGDVAIGISTGGAAPVLGRRLRERLEALLPARLGALVDFAKERRPAVAEAFSPAQRRGFWERLFSGPVAEAVYEGDMTAAEAGFAEALAVRAPSGTIHIVGAGPGDPELLTLKALRIMQEADIVLYDNLVSDGILDLIRRDAERQYVGKKKGDHSLPQADIGALMVRLAQEGKRVVRLKGGDPFIFGRGGEEVEAVEAAGLSATVVPGITAAQGCAAAAMVPLTHRGMSQAVTYVTAFAGGGGAPDVAWDALARLQHTVVVYMGVGRAGDVAAALIAGGASSDLPVAIVEKGTLDDQRIIRTQLSRMGNDIRAAGIVGPAVLVIGEVAAKAQGLGVEDLARQSLEKQAA